MSGSSTGRTDGGEVRRTAARWPFPCQHPRGVASTLGAALALVLLLVWSSSGDVEPLAPAALDIARRAEPGAAPERPGDDLLPSNDLGRGAADAPRARPSPRRASVEVLPAPPVAPPVTEKDFYEAFRARGPAALERMAAGVLDGPGPDCERVALLRALYDSKSENVVEVFSTAIRSLPDESGSQHESVPSFAVRFLGERAARDAAARAILHSVAFESRPAVALGLRRRAAAHLGATADAAELQRLSMQLAYESDSLVVDGVVAALEHNPNKLAAGAIIARFERPNR